MSDEAEADRVKARELERTRKLKETERQMAKKPRIGVGVDDGSSQKTSSSTSSTFVSAASEEINSLAMEEDQDEEEEGSAEGSLQSDQPDDDEF